MSYRNFLILGMTIIVVGIVLMSTMEEEMDTAGVVLVALGGLAMILGMYKKRIQDRGRE